ncbi:SDR family oxidoreductase [Roseibium sp. CAU 1637]|uniref:SDR family oxidoreductase n=1 Tax=Roseibium limicola TaxID=2816037 RepID=A0A939EQG4_9HYPH|nr:SDR family oxidoreductase [Roseibium limicola]MBO0347050.1 SDR family oxidoreductase [Roseibium limicola]
MDLGLNGKSAIICAASKELGKACAVQLAHEGVDVTICARSPDALDATAREIRAACNVKVSAIACDITTAEGRQRILSATPDPDILVTNAGGPPPGDFRDWGRDNWVQALNANMLTPIDLIKATVDGMIKRGFGRIVNITSAAVKAPIDVLGLSNGARAGLTGFVAGLARTTVVHNVTINNLLPGPFDTDRIAQMIEGTAKAEGVGADVIRERMMSLNPAGRFGTLAEFGAACAFICSSQSGFITGQNLLLDGGAFRSTL